MSWVTTDPAPINAWAPTVILAITMDPEPILQPSPKRGGDSSVS